MLSYDVHKLTENLLRVYNVTLCVQYIVVSKPFQHPFTIHQLAMLCLGNVLFTLHCPMQMYIMYQNSCMTLVSLPKSFVLLLW